VELPVAGVDDIRVRDDFRVETVQLLVWSVEADANATERIALLDLIVFGLFSPQECKRASKKPASDREGQRQQHPFFRLLLF